MLISVLSKITSIMSSYLAVELVSDAAVIASIIFVLEAVVRINLYIYFEIVFNGLHLLRYFLHSL